MNSLWVILLILHLWAPAEAQATIKTQVDLPLEERADPKPGAAKKTRKKTSTASKSKTQKIKPRAIKLPPPETLVIPTPTEDAAELLYPDELGKKVSHLVVGLANRLDSFFGEERSDDERNGSTLRLVPSYTFYDQRKGVSEMGVNLNLKLRNLETKAKKLETSIREGIFEKAGQSSTRMKPGPGSGTPIKEEEDWHYNFESKLAARPAIYYSGKLRVRRNFVGDFFLHHFSVSGGWDTDDYWSQKTGLQSDHALGESVLFRFINDANWMISRQTFQTTHGPSLIQTINKYNSVSYNFRMIFGSEENDFEHLQSSYSVNFRHGTPSKRIFIDLIPAYTYPRVESYNEIRSIELRLEYFFGDVES